MEKAVRMLMTEMQAGGRQRGNAEREAPERGVKRLAQVPRHQTQHKQQLEQTIAEQQLSKGIRLAAVHAQPGAARHQRRSQLNAERGAHGHRQFAVAAQALQNHRFKAKPENKPAPRNTSPASVKPSAPQAIALIKLFATVGR